MTLRTLLLAIIGSALSANVLADMAPPSPTPTASGGTGGVTFDVHTVSHSVTPFGWIMILFGFFGVVVVTVGVLRARAADNPK